MALEKDFWLGRPWMARHVSRADDAITTHNNDTRTLDLAWPSPAIKLCDQPYVIVLRRTGLYWDERNRSFRVRRHGSAATTSDSYTTAFATSTNWRQQLKCPQPNNNNKLRIVLKYVRTKNRTAVRLRRKSNSPKEGESNLQQQQQTDSDDDDECFSARERLRLYRQKPRGQQQRLVWATGSVDQYRRQRWRRNSRFLHTRRNLKIQVHPAAIHGVLRGRNCCAHIHSICEPILHRNSLLRILLFGLATFASRVTRNWVDRIWPPYTRTRLPRQVANRLVLGRSESFLIMSISWRYWWVGNTISSLDASHSREIQIFEFCGQRRRLARMFGIRPTSSNLLLLGLLEPFLILSISSKYWWVGNTISLLCASHSREIHILEFCLRSPWRILRNCDLQFQSLLTWDRPCHSGRNTSTLATK